MMRSVSSSPSDHVSRKQREAEIKAAAAAEDAVIETNAAAALAAKNAAAAAAKKRGQSPKAERDAAQEQADEAAMNEAIEENKAAAEALLNKYKLAEQVLKRVVPLARNDAKTARDSATVSQEAADIASDTVFTVDHSDAETTHNAANAAMVLQKAADIECENYTRLRHNISIMEKHVNYSQMFVSGKINAQNSSAISATPRKDDANNALANISADLCKKHGITSNFKTFDVDNNGPVDYDKAVHTDPGEDGDDYGAVDLNESARKQGLHNDKTIYIVTGSSEEEQEMRLEALKNSLRQYNLEDNKKVVFMTDLEASKNFPAGISCHIHIKLSPANKYSAIIFAPVVVVSGNCPEKNCTSASVNVPDNSTDTFAVFTQLLIRLGREGGITGTTGELLALFGINMIPSDMMVTHTRPTDKIYKKFMTRNLVVLECVLKKSLEHAVVRANPKLAHALGLVYGGRQTNFKTMEALYTVCKQGKVKKDGSKYADFKDLFDTNIGCICDEDCNKVINYCKELVKDPNMSDENIMQHGVFRNVMTMLIALNLMYGYVPFCSDNKTFSDFLATEEGGQLFTSYMTQVSENPQCLPPSYDVCCMAFALLRLSGKELTAALFEDVILRLSLDYKPANTTITSVAGDGDACPNGEVYSDNFGRCPKLN